MVKRKSLSGETNVRGGASVTPTNFTACTRESELPIYISSLHCSSTPIPDSANPEPSAAITEYLRRHKDWDKFQGSSNGTTRPLDPPTYTSRSADSARSFPSAKPAHCAKASYKSEESTVWIVTRPLESLGNGMLSSSRSNISLRHWGVLISPLSKDQLETSWAEVKSDPTLERIDVPETWGILFELTSKTTTEPIPTQRNMLDFYEFGPLSTMYNWCEAGIYHFGTTTANFDQIHSEGISLSF
jgi:hypothetical protein